MASSKEPKTEKYRGDGKDVEITKSNDPSRDGFRWLKREARGSTYTSYTQLSDRPACSFDFGSNGYTASCNLGGELCQLTVPSEEHGVITARGAKEHSPSAQIASLQRYTSNEFNFGLKLVSISPQPDPHPASVEQGAATKQDSAIGGPVIERKPVIEQGRVIERGAFNYRWPFHENILVDKVSEVESGTCARFSFIREGVLYQVMRLEQECRPEAKECLNFRFTLSSRIVLDIGLPKSFAAFDVFPGLEDPLSVWVDAKLYRYVGAGKETKLVESFSKPIVDNNVEDSNVEVNINENKDEPKPDSVVFLLAMRVYEPATHPKVQLQPLQSHEIFDWVGADPSSSWATGAMWESIFFRQEHRSSWTSELSEVTLVARCLQRILHVDIVPQQTMGSEKKRPLALLGHILLGVELDWQALFWKVRFLSKAAKFLEELASNRNDAHSHVDDRLATTRPDQSALRDVDSDRDMEMARIHSTLIKEDMERILSFVCRFLEPEEGEQRPFLRVEDNNDSSHNYYVMIAIWYLVKNCEEKAQLATGNPSHEAMAARSSDYMLPDKNINTLEKEQSRLAKMIPDDNSYFSQDESAEAALLKWYYYGSIAKLVEKNFLHQSWCPGGLDAANRKVRRLRRAAKMTLAAATSSRRPYSPRDEIVDRLAFLESELDLDYFEAQISFLATNRIRQRVFTKSINPGYLRPGQKGDTSAPWETYSLCHHSRLALANKDRGIAFKEGKFLPATEEMEVYRAKLSLFLTSDASLMRCWDRGNVPSGKAWLHAEPTAVLATTLLDIYLLDMEIARGKQVNPDGKPEASSPAQQHDPDCDPPVNWKIFRLPRRYHPPDVFQSLRDTPLKYSKSMMELIRLPHNMEGYLLREGDKARDLWGEWTATRLEESGVADQVCLLDIMAFDSGGQDTRPRVLGSKLCGDADNLVELNTPGLESRQHYSSETPTQQQMEKAKKKLESALTKSLLIQGVQHRILTTPRVCPNIVEALVFVIHPESVDCLTNHLLGFSRFFCHVEEPWLARITFRSWHLEDDDPVKPTSTSQTQTWADSKKEDDPIELPEQFKEALKRLDPEKYKDHQEKPRRIATSLSSMVVSTNSFGDFSKTTIISDLVSEETLQRVGTKVKELWRIFVHQPQTARCLVFLFFLGRLARKIEKQYLDAAGHLIGNWNLHDNLLVDKIDHLENQHSLETLKFIMWRLESLHKLQKSLDETVEAISCAKSELLAQIYDKTTNKRSKGLETVCKEIIEAFESRLLALEAAKMRIRHAVDLHHRQRDDASTIFDFYQNQNAFDQNQTSIEQNKTMERFTYPTILYLPAGLMAAIFAIPAEQNVVRDGMGLGWFIFAIALLVCFTTAIAIQLPGIVKGITSHLKKRGKGGRLVSDPVPEKPKVDPKKLRDCPERLKGGPERTKVDPKNAQVDPEKPKIDPKILHVGPERPKADSEWWTQATRRLRKLVSNHEDPQCEHCENVRRPGPDNV